MIFKDICCHWRIYTISKHIEMLENWKDGEFLRLECFRGFMQRFFIEKSEARSNECIQLLQCEHFSLLRKTSSEILFKAHSV